MTDRDVMDRVGAYLKRAVIADRPRKDGYKTPFIVSIKGLDAVRLMVSTRPELGEKRRAQIDHALHDWGIGRDRWSYAGMSCAVVGCGAGAATRDLCDRHFNQWYKAKRRGSTTSFEPRPMSRDDVLRPPVDHAATPDCDLAWLAGLLEGEGTFTRTYSPSGFYPVLSVKMCSRDIVERAAILLGVSRVAQRRPKNPAWSLEYAAKIGGAAAALWMQRLRPLMGERRRAAIDLALDDYYPVRLLVAPEHCVVPGCEAPPRGRGLCHKHYMSWSRDRAKGRVPRVKPLRSN